MCIHGQRISFLLICVCLCLMPVYVSASGATPEIQRGTRLVEHDVSVFRPDPQYLGFEYDAEEQLIIYGGKSKQPVQRPLLELGRVMYSTGQFKEPSHFLGVKNPVEQQLIVYGDWRTALANNITQLNEESLVATRLNIDIDYKITATERVHLIVTPFEKNGQFMRHVFKSDVAGNEGRKSEIDFTLDAIYFEGDLGAIVSGFSSEYSGFDLPFAVGLMPLLFQNGVWLDDAFLGLAVTIPARNSPLLNISNYDVTFFAGFDDVSTALNGVNVEDNVNIYAVTAFIDANNGYWEVGYGFTDGKGSLNDQDYHNATIAFTRRYGGWLSNSVRVISNYGQERNLIANPGAINTADGTLLLIENSLITSKPSTLIPYMNLFIGSGRPQSLARGAAAGGVLKNTGINFETDGLTGYPTLDATAAGAYGGAIGVEYLFALNRQLVVELSAVVVSDLDKANVTNDQFAVGVRFQQPLNHSWIFRADAMVADFGLIDNISGIRFELRKKF